MVIQSQILSVDFNRLVEFRWHSHHACCLRCALALFRHQCGDVDNPFQVRNPWRDFGDDYAAVAVTDQDVVAISWTVEATAAASAAKSVEGLALFLELGRSMAIHLIPRRSNSAASFCQHQAPLQPP